MAALMQSLDGPTSITAADVTAPMGQALLALNNAHAQELSWLEPDRLRHLVARSSLAWRIGDMDALLLAFNESADYDGANFLWFRQRYRRFIYVDRIVVAPSARGRGLARGLYAEVFGHAEETGSERIVCEVNAEPPNPASRAFHAALGFREVGTAASPGGARTVTYLERLIDRPI